MQCNLIVSSGVTHLPLLCTDIRCMRVHFGPSGPVIFLLMSTEFGKKIRNVLGMTNHQNFFYDPESIGALLTGLLSIFSFFLSFLLLIFLQICISNTTKLLASQGLLLNTAILASLLWSNSNSLTWSY